MRLILHASPVELSRYRPEIDGLRAVAILPVLFFHTGISGFSGGFVGVDIFFVISGYLITTIVAGDVAQGRFSFARFYERRIRRIFPALFFALVVCTVLAAIIFPPGDFSEFGKSLLAVTFFVSNIFFWRTEKTHGYFDPGSDSQALLHTWTLSVEEQFYVFLPICLVLINCWAGRYLKPIFILIMFGSFVLSLWAVEYKPVGAFYLLPTRAWELLIGGLLAIKAFPRIESRVIREAAGFIGLALIGYAVFVFTKDTPFPGLYALAPCLGASMIIYACEAGSSSTRTILGTPALTFVGVISYSLYLWHWPIIVFAKYFEISDLSATEIAGVILLSLIMAFVSYQWIEKPFRRPNPTWTRRRIFQLGAIASFTCAGLGLVIFADQGMPERYDQQTQRLIAENTARKTEHGYMRERECTHWQKQIFSAAQTTGCPIGEEKPKKIMFWGDSHIEMLQLSIRRLYDQGALNDHGVLFALAEGCPPAETVALVRPNFYCESFAHFAMLRAQQSDVDTVFIAFATWWDVVDFHLCAIREGRCQGRLSQGDFDRLFIGELTKHIRDLRALGKTVVVSLPFPLYDRSIPDLEIHNLMFAKYGSTFSPQEVGKPELRERIRTAVTAAGGVVFDPRRSLCSTGECIYQTDGVSIYTDHSHIAVSQTGYLDQNLRTVLGHGASASGVAGP